MWETPNKEFLLTVEEYQQPNSLGVKILLTIYRREGTKLIKVLLMPLKVVTEL